MQNAGSAIPSASLFAPCLSVNFPTGPRGSNGTKLLRFPRKGPYLS